MVQSNVNFSIKYNYDYENAILLVSRTSSIFQFLLTALQNSEPNKDGNCDNIRNILNAFSCRLDYTMFDGNFNERWFYKADALKRATI